LFKYVLPLSLPYLYLLIAGKGLLVEKKEQERSALKRKHEETEESTVQSEELEVVEKVKEVKKHPKRIRTTTQRYEPL
jgi:hypothetical protein